MTYHYKTIIIILTGSFLLSCQPKYSHNYGSVLLTNNFDYDMENLFIPHDTAVDKYMIQPTLHFEKVDNVLKIVNGQNIGFGGHTVTFLVNSDLEILNVEYDFSSDVIDGSTTKYSVEKVIFFMDVNPFVGKQVTAHYTLQVKEAYSAGPILRKEGKKDTVRYNIFYGKFRGEVL